MSAPIALLQPFLGISSFTIDDLTYQTRVVVFHQDIQTHREESLKYDAQRSIFDEIGGVWIADETLSQVFDISIKTKTIIYAN